MTDEEYQKKKLIRNLLDNPLFEPIIMEIKSELGLIMLEATDEAKRIEIHSLNKALDRLVGYLTEYANEVRALDG
jgi:hypothetical protein